eukprot:scaffold549_cov385-Prasinococcus_capsulatus_cf.AAC.34
MNGRGPRAAVLRAAPFSTWPARVRAPSHHTTARAGGSLGRDRALTGGNVAERLLVAVRRPARSILWPRKQQTARTLRSLTQAARGGREAGAGSQVQVVPPARWCARATSPPPAPPAQLHAVR